MEKCSELERWKEKELNMRKMTLSITLIISLVATTAILLLSFSTVRLYYPQNILYHDIYIYIYSMDCITKMP